MTCCCDLVHNVGTIHDLSAVTQCTMEGLYMTHCLMHLEIISEMSHKVRKLVFGVSDRVQHKQGCTTTEDC